MKDKPVWEETGRGNVILKDEKCFVSYAAKTLANPFADMIGGIVGLESAGLEETALKIDGTWYILNGDFRKEYEEAWPDPKACLAIYKANIDKRSDWSTDRQEKEE